MNSEEGFKGFESSGHAGLAPRGKDILCAGVTVLLRTTGRVLAARGGIDFSFRGDKPGSLSLFIHTCPPDLSSWLQGVRDTLIQGLNDLAEEYPKNLKIQII